MWLCGRADLGDSTHFSGAGRLDFDIGRVHGTFGVCHFLVIIVAGVVELAGVKIGVACVVVDFWDRKCPGL